MIGERGKFWLKVHDIRNPECELCPLNNSSQHVCVMGRGHAWAPIMLIGEAPGEAEGRTGKPFMGAAGQLLNRVLKDNRMANLVYITNVCKCRPPENREPKPDEQRTCTKNYLNKEVALLLPRVIVLLGKSPAKHFFDRNIPKRGVPTLIGFPGGFNTTIMCTWHPAAHLYGNKVALAQLTEHLKKAKEIAYADLHRAI
jgi:uracil-DNA glycosylase